MDKFCLALTIFMVLNVLTLFAQETPVYNHFYNTPYLFNPAEAGAEPYMSVSLNHRQQWRGIDGAPVVTTLTFESPFDYKKWAFGATLRNFQRGLLSTTDFLATYSYTVYLNPRTSLHFGLSAGLTNNSIDVTEIQDLSDPVVSNFLDNNIQPIANFGLKLTSQNGFNLGISLPRLFKPQYVNNRNFEAFAFSPLNDVTVLAYFKRPIDSKIVTRRQGGYKRRVKIEDTFAPLQIYALYQYSQIVGQRIELLTTLNLNENVWVGGSYRLNYGASGIFGVKIKNLSFSYSYEPSSKQVSGFAQGSHEVQLKYTIGDKKKLERNKPKLRTLDRAATRAPRFSSNDVQLGGGEEHADEAKKYYVVVKEYKDFNSADKLVKKIKKDLELISDIFYNKSNGVYYVYIYETFSRRDANRDKQAAEELTKFKDIKIIIVDIQ
jgi:type IX secretion system PorP/SprF family membrane protein